VWKTKGENIITRGNERAAQIAGPENSLIRIRTEDEVEPDRQIERVRGVEKKGQRGSYLRIGLFLRQKWGGMTKGYKR